MSLDLTVESLAAGGDGVARVDGRVVFVPFTAPGDRVRIELTEERRSFARGRVVELLEPGPSRTDPVCAVFGSCGGCAWQHVDYAAQLEAKSAILGDALTRIGGFELAEPVPVRASVSPYAYRGRARAHVEKGRAGFLRRRSHRLCATDRCPVLVPELQSLLGEVAARPPVGDGELELAVGDDGQARCFVLGQRPERTVAVRLEVGEEELRFSPGVFFQANATLRSALAEAVLVAAGHGASLLELFAGAGFFTIGLARHFERVVAVEQGAAAAADLRANLARAGLVNVAVEARPAEASLANTPPAEVVVLDPPRVGLGPEASRRLAQLEPRRVVYLSCDPATLARDLAVVAGEGYRLAAVTGFDLFPQTPHVEALAVLERA